jgi:hypothetical protein
MHVTCSTIHPHHPPECVCGALSGSIVLLHCAQGYGGPFANHHVCTLHFHGQLRIVIRTGEGSFR